MRLVHALRRLPLPADHPFLSHVQPLRPPARPCTHLALLPQILKDDISLKDSSVTESGFCVVMIMKVC